jgi:hypothetical protein
MIVDGKDLLGNLTRRETGRMNKYTIRRGRRRERRKGNFK